MATVTGVRVSVLLRDFLEAGVQTGRFVRERGALTWERVAIRCPYCPHLRLQRPRGPGSRATGRIIYVEGPDGAAKQTVIVDPWPKGMCFLSCGACKSQFVMETRRVNAANRAARSGGTV